MFLSLADLLPSFFLYFFTFLQNKLFDKLFQKNHQGVKHFRSDFCQGSSIDTQNSLGIFQVFMSFKVSKGAKIRNRYNQIQHLTQDTKTILLTFFFRNTIRVSNNLDQDQAQR